MTRAELNQAFREVASMEFAEVLYEDEISYCFSDAFVRKMEKLIARQRKPYWKYANTAAKRVAIVAILVICIAMTALSNEEVRASMLQWCSDVYEEYIRYYFEGDTTKVIEHEYRLTMIPEGFEKVYEQRDKENVVIGYENENGNYIQFEQHATEVYEFVVDNEQMEWSNIIIDDEEVKMYEHPDLIGAIWIEDGYAMHIVYHGCQDVKTIYEMIHTIE